MGLFVYTPSFVMINNGKMSDNKYVIIHILLHTTAEYANENKIFTII